MAIGALAILVIIGGIIILPIILIGVLLASKRNKTSPSSPIQHEAAAINPAARNQRREAILGQLASKEISSEEAEQQLLELDNPLPEQMPMAPPPKSGCGSGCLVAALCGLAAFGILLLLVISLFFAQVKTVDYHEVRIEEMR